MEPSRDRLGLSASQQASITSAAGHAQLDVGALGLRPDQAAAVGRAFSDAFMSGFRFVLVAAGLALLAAALVANRYIPGRHAVVVHAPGEVPVAAEA